MTWAGGALPVGGGMHADLGCATCEVWLHENHFPGGRPAIEPEQQKLASIRIRRTRSSSSSRKEIRSGNRIYGPGTAVAIAADTLYSFTAGPAARVVQLTEKHAAGSDANEILGRGETLGQKRL